MKNILPNSAAFLKQDNGINNGYSNGLTKREYFSAMAMVALLPNWNGVSDETLKNKADAAVKMADALINRLNELD